MSTRLFSQVSHEGPMPSVTLPQPRTGRKLCRARLILGVSARAVAHRLRVSTPTILRHEAVTEPLDDDWASEWRTALAYCGQERLRNTTRYGLTIDGRSVELRRSHLASPVRSLVSSTDLPSDTAS